MRAYDESEFTYRSLGEASGVVYSQAYKMLRGEKAMTIDEFVALCDALGIEPVAVIDEATGENFGIESLEPPTPLHPHTREENLPDFTQLAARRVTTRPEWEKRQALDDIGEESQDPGDYED